MNLPTPVASIVVSLVDPFQAVIVTLVPVTLRVVRSEPPNSAKVCVCVAAKPEALRLIVSKSLNVASRTATSAVAIAEPI